MGIDIPQIRTQAHLYSLEVRCGSSSITNPTLTHYYTSIKTGARYRIIVLAVLEFVTTLAANTHYPTSSHSFRNLFEEVGSTDMNSKGLSRSSRLRKSQRSPQRD